MENEEKDLTDFLEEEKATVKQLALIHSIKKSTQLKDETDWRNFLKEKYGVETASALTKQQASLLIDELKKMKEKAFEEKVESITIKSEENIETEEIASSAVRTGFIEPAVTLDKAIESFKLFEEAKSKILTENDIIWLGPDGKPTTKDKGKPHILRSGWRKLARFFGLSFSVELVKKIKERDEKGEYYIYISRAVVEHPSGARSIMDGVASSRDPFFTKGGTRAPDEENIIMKSQTVALNRAISDLLGSGEISAEEVEK